MNKKIYDAKRYAENRAAIKERNKKWYWANKEKTLRQYTQYYQINKNKIHKQRNEYMSANIVVKLASYLRNRLYYALQRKKRIASPIRNLGCSLSKFKLYIENQFEKGMSWDNYGDWHLDHVLPLSYFNLTNKQEFLTACNWLNYQPLWAKDNLSKGAKVA